MAGLLCLSTIAVADTLLAAHRVFQASDGVLNLAGDLIRLAFGLEFGVAEHLAGDLFDFALGLLGRALDPVLVHLILRICRRATG